MSPLVSLPRLPGSGHPLPGPVGAAPGWRGFGSYSAAQRMAQTSHLLLPREGTPSVSPAPDNSLSLHLNREELSGATLEHRGVTSAFQKSLHPCRTVP